MTTYDAIVVGAGIVGSAIARECTRAGLQVAVVEAGVPGGGSTAAGMGHLVAMDDSPAQLALTTYSRSLWQSERDTMPPGVEYESRGTLWLAADDDEMEDALAKGNALRQGGVDCFVLGAGELAREEPNLRRGLAGALLVPEDAVIYPPAAAAFYLKEAIDGGAQLVRARAVEAARGTVRLSDGCRLSAPVIALASGADSSLLPAMPLRKRKGHLVITDRYPDFAFHQLVELGYVKSASKLMGDSVAFNLQPRRTGQMLIGSSRQYGDETTLVNETSLRRMLARAEEYMPAVGSLSVLRVWTGFRAATADKLPLLGPAQGVAEDSSLWLAVGFEGLGITNAPGAARLLADMLVGRPSAIDPTPFLPARLAAQGELACA